MTIETKRTFHPIIERYAFDFDLCPASTGWAQVDTANDASYFGTWANAAKREIVQFVEGDIIITKCDTDAEFAGEVRRIADWHREDGSWKGIDCMCRPDIEQRFAQAGLADLLH